MPTVENASSICPHCFGCRIENIGSKNNIQNNAGIYGEMERLHFKLKLFRDRCKIRNKKALGFEIRIGLRMEFGIRIGLEFRKDMEMLGVAKHITRMYA